MKNTYIILFLFAILLIIFVFLFFVDIPSPGGTIIEKINLDVK